MTAAEGRRREPWGERLAHAARVLVDRRVLVIMLLGFSSGLPLALSGSTLLLWMKDVGVDIKTIGFFALVGTPYTIKFLWAPLVDAFQIPVLGRLLGHRRGWLVFTQLLLIAAIAFLGFQNPLTSLWWVALAAVIVATVSATQDIVIDAFRTEYLPTDAQATGMAYYVAAYRIAMLVSSGILVGFVAYLQYAGVASDLIWSIGYVAMSALILIGLAGALLAEEPARKGPAEPAADGASQRNPLTRFFSAAYAAFADFLSKRDAWLILLFVVIYKLTDTFAGVMTGPFVLDIGFDKASYAAIVKGVGFVASLLGGFAGGLLARALPLSRALLVAGILQALANFAFSWVAWLGVNHAALTFAITAENFTSAIGTVVFVAYLSALCTTPAYTATQFALLTALSAFGRTQLAAITGLVAAAVGWFWFFALCAAAAIPGLLILWVLVGRGNFEAIERKERAETARS
jgi:MFS transporter, PAT family, beta-lactamase induction signal transducer AmpG